MSGVADLTVATTAADFATARLLFEEYAAQLGVDLCFQDFSGELTRLPEMYGPPRGRLWIAHSGRELVGCIGLRPLSGDPDACEMKRLYVRTRARGQGLGRRLAVASIEAARELGYARMVLDTLGSMVTARALYAELGFTPIEPYYPNPKPDVVYLQLML